MDSKTKKEWLKALRSGEYKQGDGALRKEVACHIAEEPDTEERFCCLGVLCDLVEPNQWRRLNNEWVNGVSSDDGGMPRKDLLEELGLDRNINRSGRKNSTIAEHLAHMNDGGKTFKEIANWIEKRSF